MKRLLLIFGLLISVATAEPYHVVVQAKDGHAFIRDKASEKGKVLAKVENGTILENSDTFFEKGWTEVTLYRENGKEICGYIKSSSEKDVWDLPKHKAGKLTFSYVSKAFKKAGKKLKWHKDGRLVAIDGKLPIGAAWMLPETEVVGVKVVFKGKKLNVPVETYANLYNANNSVVEIYDYSGGILISSMFGDGGEAFLTLWRVDKKGKVTRLF